MKLNEVTHWPEYTNENGECYNLSFLDAKKLRYTHKKEGKKDIHYDFWVTYSLHCFAKDYDHLQDDERRALMYTSPKRFNGKEGESRPFCLERYSLAFEHLTTIIENLSSSDYTIKDAGYESYLTVKLISNEEKNIWYNVPFKVFREEKKYRLHVMSAYPTDKPRGGGKVGFFIIAHNLRMNKPMPRNRKR